MQIIGGTLLIVLCGIVTFPLIIAQSAPCTTPVQQPGSCVPIKQCRNIYNIVQNPTPPSAGIANYIRRAACTLPGVERSVCCQLSEVVPEPTTTAKPTTVAQTASTVEKLALLPDKCGQSIFDRIAFGNDTKVFSFPWMALLQYDNRGTKADGCGGSLINNRYILTAGHCLRTRSTLKLTTVVLGEHTKNQLEDCNIYYNNGQELDRDCAEPIEEYGVESVIVHPSYNRPKYSNDIGLIRLNREVTFKDHIRPICLPVKPEYRSMALDKFILTGWGTTENNTLSERLLQAVMPHVSLEDCRRRLAESRLNVDLSDLQLCAGGDNRVDSCKGDSGGPLGFTVNYNGARFMQFGVVSFGVDSCGQVSVPGIYARVGSYMDWILEQIQP